MRTHLAVSYASFALGLLLLAAPGTSRADNIFVSNQGNNTIEEFNSSGIGSIFASAGVNDPSVGLTFDNSGNLYLSEYGTGTIEKFDKNGRGTVFATTGISGSQGLAFDKNGNLYMASEGEVASDSYNEHIYEFNRNGVGAVFAVFNYSAGGLSGISPIGLAFDNSGNLYSANQSALTANGYAIEEFNKNGVGTLFASLGLNYPTGLAFDKNGNLYVANAYWGTGNPVQPGQNTIEKFDTNGVGTVFANSGLDNPQGMAFDSAGNLYVANLGNGTIEEFNTNGVGTVFASGLDRPVGLAIQVPEPSARTLLAVSLIALLPLSRRRSQK